MNEVLAMLFVLNMLSMSYIQQYGRLILDKLAEMED
jgi:hypothetical protein